MNASDFQIIADIISGLPNLCGLRNKVAHHFAEKLKARYNRFKTDAFLKACMVSNQDDEE